MCNSFPKRCWSRRSDALAPRTGESQTAVVRCAHAHTPVMVSFDGALPVCESGDKKRVSDSLDPWWPRMHVRASNVPTNRMTRLKKPREASGGCREGQQPDLTGAVFAGGPVRRSVFTPIKIVFPAVRFMGDV